MLGYFRKVTNTVLPARSRGNQESDTDDDEENIILPASKSQNKKKTKKVFERQRSLKSKAEEIRTLSSTVNKMTGKLFISVWAKGMTSFIIRPDMTELQIIISAKF